MIGCSQSIQLFCMFYLGCTEYIHKILILDLKPNLRAFGVALGGHSYHQNVMMDMAGNSFFG